MEMNNKVTRHKYGHRGLNEFNSVNESVAKREFYNNRLKKEQEAVLEAQTIREAELNKQATLLENINNRKINEIKMTKTKNVLHEAVMDKLVKVAFTQAFMESLYLDDNYKIDNSEKLASVVESFVDDNGGHKLLENAVKQNKDSLFLKSIYEACKSTAEKITREKCKEADNDPEKIDFDVRLDDLDEFKEDLSKTNIDALGKIVKDKVLNTVIEEKERSIKKQEFEEDIKNGVDDAVTESMKYKIHNKNVIEQPSLFSAMMRKNYSEMLEESVSIIQTYSPNDKLSEIGLDETEVDYNDKNEHSLTGIDEEKLVTTKSMKPENKMDDYSGGNSSFDNSALATLDDDSDDIDMFALTNESVESYDDIEDGEIAEESNISIWDKFVNTKENINESFNDYDEIEDILESFTDVEVLTEADEKKPGFIEKAKAIIKKILDFFRNIKDKILSIFRKKVETINDKISELSSDNSDDNHSETSSDNSEDDSKETSEDKKEKKLGTNSRYSGTLRTAKPNTNSSNNDKADEDKKEKKLGTNSRYSGNLHKTRGYFIDFSPQDVIKNVRQALDEIDYDNSKSKNYEFEGQLTDIVFDINKGNFYSDDKKITEYMNKIEQTKIVSVTLEEVKEEETLISNKEKDQILKDFSAILNGITKYIQTFSKDINFMEGVLKRFNDKKIESTPQNNVTLFLKAINKLKEIYNNSIVDATKLLEYTYKYLCRFKNTKVSYKESTDEIEDILESFTDVEVLTEADNNNKSGFKEKIKSILKKIMEFFRNIKNKILSLFRKKTVEIKNTIDDEIKKCNNDDNNITDDTDSKKDDLKLSRDKRSDRYGTTTLSSKKPMYELSFNPDEFIRDVISKFDNITATYNRIYNQLYDIRKSIGITNSDNKIEELKSKLSEIKSGEYNNVEVKKENTKVSPSQYKKFLDRCNGTIDDINNFINIIENNVTSAEKTCVDTMKEINQYNEEIFNGFNEKREMFATNHFPLMTNILTKLKNETSNGINAANQLLSIINLVLKQSSNLKPTRESFISVLDEDDEFIYESVLDEYESVLESDDEFDNMIAMEAAVDSMEFDEDGVLYEELMVTDDFIKDTVQKMSDKQLQAHLPKLEKMVEDLTNDLKIAKSGEIPSLKNPAIGPIKKFFIKMNVKLSGLTPEKAAKNIQEFITIGKKEITFVKAELKKRGLKPLKESSVFISVLDEYDYLSENLSTIEESVEEVDVNSPEYIAMESIAKLGNDNNLRIDQRRRVVRLCESLSVAQLADLTAKYRNEAVYLNENIAKLSNMNDMDKAVYVYEASLNKEGYNFNEELNELTRKIDICNEQVGLFNIAAKILVTLESLGLTEACKKGKKKSVCSECGDDLLDSTCKDCGTVSTEEGDEISIDDNVVEESSKPSAEVFMDKVLCESLIQYTLLEMMYTAKVVNYTSSDVKRMALELTK